MRRHPSSNDVTRPRALAVRQDGFTLAELLVVVAILGVLVAIAFPAYSGFTKRAQTTADAANTRTAVVTTAATEALDTTPAGPPAATQSPSAPAARPRVPHPPPPTGPRPAPPGHH